MNFRRAGLCYKIILRFCVPLALPDEDLVNNLSDLPIFDLQIKGKIKFRGDHLDRLQGLYDTRESQYMSGQSRNVSYVSRLQSVQAAVCQQIQEMASEHPDRRPALIAFSSDVSQELLAI